MYDIHIVVARVFVETLYDHPSKVITLLWFSDGTESRTGDEDYMSGVPAYFVEKTIDKEAQCYVRYLISPCSLGTYFVPQGRNFTYTGLDQC